jgi:hypothetical protein
MLDELQNYSNTLANYDKIFLDFLLLPFVYKESYVPKNCEFKIEELLIYFTEHYQELPFRILLNDFLNKTGFLLENKPLLAVNDIVRTSSLDDKMECVGTWF